MFDLTHGVFEDYFNVLAIAQATGYVLVGVVTASFLLLGAVYTSRINREVGKLDTTTKRTESLQVGQASLIDDLQAERPRSVNRFTSFSKATAT